MTWNGWQEPHPEDVNLGHYVARNFLPRPRTDTGEVVERGMRVEGLPSPVASYCVYDSGWWTVLDEGGYECKGWNDDRLKLLPDPEPDTQERIDEDAMLDPRLYYNDHIGHDVGLRDDATVYERVIRDLLRRQRELDAKTMGGE